MATKGKTVTKGAAKKRVAKKRKVGAKKKPAKKKTVKKKPVRKKPAGKRVAKKKAKKKVVKKPVGKRATPSMSNEAARLAAAVRHVEEALEKASSRLADARERVAHAATTARTKRTVAAHAAADRARQAIAAINERRIEVTARLIAARDAIKEQHPTVFDWRDREQALKDALERYEQVLKAFDRRVTGARRTGERRKR